MRNAILTLAALTASLSAQAPTLLRDIDTDGVAGTEYAIVQLGTRWVFRGTTPATGDELFTCAAPSFAVSLLRDVAPGVDGSAPEHLTVAGNRLFFFADDGVHGLEPWVSDGTPGGTMLLADIRPGANPSVVIDGYGRGPLAVLGSSVYFVADDGVRGAELWTSDGTSAGTRLVTDLVAGPGSPDIRQVRAGAAHVFFNAAALASNLWRSDGTLAGTVALGSFYAPPDTFTTVGATTYFVAAGSTAEGYELWKSDGTLAGTTLVKDIWPGNWNSSYPSGFTPLGGRLFFDADDGVHGREPWVSDGTPGGTMMVGDIRPGTVGSMYGNYRQQWLTLGNRVVFAADDGVRGMEPWVSDGTAAGTALLRDLRAGAAGSVAIHAFSVWRRTQAGTARAFFAADDGVAGKELWSTDGTPGGTVLAADLLPGSAGSNPARITADASGTALVIGDATPGSALWVASTTSASLITRDVARAPRQSRGANPRELTVLGAHVLFAANEPATGNELWRTDGTGAGTTQVRDINPGSDHGFERGDPEFYGVGAFAAARLGGDVLFAAYDARLAVGLWKSDGTTAGTVKVRPLDRTAGGLGYTIAGDSFRDLLFFTAYRAGAGWSLWVTDGTAGNTVPLHASGTTDFLNLNRVVRLGQRMLWFFSHGYGTGGFTVASVSPFSGALTPIASLPGSTYATVLAPTRVGARLCFMAPLAGTDAALWSTDGVSATPLVASLGAAPVARRQLARFGDHVYFMAGSAAAGVELWRSDGTAAGTALFADLAPGAGSSSPRSFAVAGDRLFFAADDGPNVALWTTDGTPVGTAKVASLPGSGYAPPDLLSMTAVGSRRVYFSLLYGAGTGSELWRSDGTAAGTALVADLNPGVGGSPPHDLTPHRGRLLFVADDGWRGMEPWVLHPGATAMTYGAGCAATGFEPELRATDPVLGAALTFRVRGAVANVAGVALFGAPSFPEQQLGLGCALAVAPAGSVGVAFATDASGRFASAPLAVPNDPTLVGAQLALQAAVGPTANLPLPLDFSNGVLLTFGR